MLGKRTKDIQINNEKIYWLLCEDIPKYEKGLRAMRMLSYMS